MKDLTSLGPLSPLSQGLQSPSAAAPSPSVNFGSIFKEMVSKVHQAQVSADRQVEELHSGGARNLHEVMLALEQADISMQMLVQTRNKVVDAYQEIMRLQI